MIIQNKCQMRFLDSFILKQTLIKLMITENASSMLNSPFNSYDDEMNTGFSKSKCLKLIIKH